MDEDARRAIFADSGGHAALTRQLASAACRQRGSSSTVTHHHYELGLEWLETESGAVDEYFEENLWGPSTPAERRLLALSRSADGVAEEELERVGPVPVFVGGGEQDEAEPPGHAQLDDWAIGP